MTEIKYIDTLKNLYALRKFTNSLDMIYHTKKSINDRIDFEIDLVESQVFRQLGKKRFEEMCLEE